MRLIDADALVRKMDDYVTVHNALRDVERVDGVLIAKSFIDEQPTVDAVPVKSIEQLKWERDTAIQQLEEHGIPFCGKADVVAVVRCAECKYSHPYMLGLYRCDRTDIALATGKDEYCSRGVRKDDA